MMTMMQISAFVMLLLVFLGQLPAMLALLQSTWTTVSGWVSGLATAVKGLFGSKSA